MNYGRAAMGAYVLAALLFITGLLLMPQGWRLILWIPSGLLLAYGVSIDLRGLRAGRKAS